MAAPMTKENGIRDDKKRRTLTRLRHPQTRSRHPLTRSLRILTRSRRTLTRSLRTPFPAIFFRGVRFLLPPSHFTIRIL